LAIDEHTVSGSGTDNDNAFEIEDGERDGRNIKFVMKMEDGDDKYYWGEFNPWMTHIFGSISDAGFDVGPYRSEMAALKKS